jgi:hypothetical protein
MQPVNAAAKIITSARGRMLLDSGQPPPYLHSIGHELMIEV